MEIKKEKTGSTLSVTISGELGAVEAPALEKIVKQELDGIAYLVFDLKDLVYVASAGLRLFLLAQKRMNKQGSMKLVHVNPEVKDVLDMTGYLKFLTLEE